MPVIFKSFCGTFIATATITSCKAWLFGRASRRSRWHCWNSWGRRPSGRSPISSAVNGRATFAIYYASGVRGNKPEEEIDYLQKLVAAVRRKAIKFRLGGRMSKNADSLPGRTEALIPLVRKTFGDGLTLYADSNSSYDAKEAIRIGRIMEANGLRRSTKSRASSTIFGPRRKWPTR